MITGKYSELKWTDIMKMIIHNDHWKVQ